MTDKPIDTTVQIDDEGHRFVLLDGEKHYLSTDPPPMNHGPFTDDEGAEFFLTHPDPETGVSERYYPPQVEAPLFYTCEHGSSNEPDICILIAHPDAKPMPDDWHADPAAAYTLAPPHVRAKVAAAQAGVMLDSVSVT